MTGDVGIVALGSYLPGDPIKADEVGPPEVPMAQSPLFRPPSTRHHVSPGQTAGDMVERAARPMFRRLGLEPDGHVQLLMTNTLLPDTPITGCGAEVAHRLGFNPGLIVDLHNGGCAAFPYMLKLAPAIMSGSGATTALLCTVQNTAGQVYRQPQWSQAPQATLPGDGSGVAYLKAGAGSPVLAAVVRNDPASASDMQVAPIQRKYWEAGTGEFNVSFNPDAFKDVLDRGNTLVPRMVRELSNCLDLQPNAIDILITNQPNRQFLRNWRRDLNLDPEKHVDTFDRFGNLYGAAVMVTLDYAVRDGTVRDGDLVVVAGFAHAGDLAAAAAIRWRSPTRGASGDVPTEA